MICLLDINVLIALLDTHHEFHKTAKKWLLSDDVDVWATCPLTENGVIRIMGQSAYSNFAGGPQEVRAMVEHFVNSPRHQFWPDEITLFDRGRFPELPASKHLTDVYLLGLAVHRSAKLATLDHRIEPTIVVGGEATVHLIE